MILYFGVINSTSLICISRPTQQILYVHYVSHYGPYATSTQRTSLRKTNRRAREITPN